VDAVLKNTRKIVYNKMKIFKKVTENKYIVVEYCINIFGNDYTLFGYIK
jgi:hypothetical protein